MDLKSFFISVGTIVLESIQYTNETTVVSRETGRIAKRFPSWEDYTSEKRKYPNVKYIVIDGARRVKNKN